MASVNLPTWRHSGAGRLSGVLRCGGQRSVLPHHRRRRAPPVAVRLRHVLARTRHSAGSSRSPQTSAFSSTWPEPWRAGPGRARILRTWLRVRLSSGGAAAAAVVAAGVFLLARDRDAAVPMILLALVYLAGGLVEFLHYFYRGLSRTRHGIVADAGAASRHAGLRADRADLAARRRHCSPWRCSRRCSSTLVISARLAARLGRNAQLAARDATDRQTRPAARVLARDVPDRRRHRAVGPVFPDRRLPHPIVARHRGGRALQRGLPAGRSAAALSGGGAGRGAAVAVSARERSSVAASVARPHLFAAATTVVVWATAGWLVPLLYGARFADAVPAFRILALSFPLMSLNYALTHQLIGWDGHRAYAAICARGARRQRGDQRRAHPLVVDRRRGVGDAVDRNVADRRLRRRAVAERLASNGGGRRCCGRAMRVVSGLTTESP